MINRLALELAVPAAALALLTIFLLPHGASAAAPANDNQADASTVVALPFSDTFNNSNATNETDEPTHCNFSKTVWYKLTSPVTGRLIVETYGSDFDTGVAVYTQANDLIICNDDYSGVQSEVAFDAQMGQVYWIQTGGYSGHTGNMMLHINLASEYAQITGTVRSAADSVPLEGICVTLYSQNLQRRANTRTMAEGAYALEGLVAGDYFVAFIDCQNSIYAGSFLTNTQTRTDATTITLTTGQLRTGIDTGLAVGGTLSGAVTDVDTGLPIANICVYTSTSEYIFDTQAETDENGNYTLTGLANTYTLQFENCNSNTGTQYVSEYYPHGIDQNAATQVAVHPDDMLTGFDMALQVGGSVSGTLTNRITGAPLGDPCVELYIVHGSNDEAYFTSTSVNDDGTYTLVGLPSGKFKVNAYDCGGPQFDTVWFDGKSSQAAATIIELAAVQAMTGVDFSITLNPIAGDADCNGTATMSDLILGLRYLGGLDEGPDCASTLLNLDCNAGTNGRDMLVLVRYLAGLPMTVPATCPAPGDPMP
jgi:hypothetical protein